MADSKNIKAPYFKKSEIQAAVDDFCTEYHIDQLQVPLDVELIVESDLRLELRPEANLHKRTDLDALLTTNRKTIVVDLERFTKQHMQNRLRFTIAHEIGHYILHEELYRGIAFDSVEDWLKFFENFPPIEYRKLEWHCDEFAGRLLIHGDLLRKKFAESRLKLAGTEWEKIDPLPVYVVEAMVGEIAKFFGVSDLPILIRLESEGIWTRDGN